MKKLEHNIQELEKVINNIDLTDVIQETEKEFTREVVDLSRRAVKPDTEEGQSLVDKCNILRRLGSSILNLLKIEFTVTFAGATLIHWEIPKIDSKTLTVKNSKK